MSIEVLYETASLPECDLVGILIAETQLCGIVNNCPLKRRKPVPVYPLDLYADNDRRLRVYIRDGDMNIVDLTGATCVFTVKLTKNDTSPVIQKSTAVSGEGEIGSADQGECFFYILPSDTDSLDIAQYVYDVKVTLSDGKTYTAVEGVVNLLQGVG